MKRNIFILICLTCLLTLSCENLVTTLPETDISQYKTVTGFTFPAKTKIVDVYNCLTTIGITNNEVRDITGNAVLRSSVILNDFHEYTDTQTRTVKRISVTYSEKEPEIHTYTITFYFDYSGTLSSDFNYEKNKTLPDNQKKMRNAEFIFKWQRQTTNMWQNDRIPYEITITV